MYWPARAGFLIVIGVMVLGLLTPPIIFDLDMSNGGILKYSVKEEQNVNSTHVIALVGLEYRGRLPLSGFKLILGSSAIDFGTVTTGNYTKRVVLPRADIDSRIVGMSFKLVFYNVKIITSPAGG